MRREIYDHRGDVVKVLHTEAGNPTGYIETIQDLEPIIDEVKALRENHAQGGHMKHAARVPMIIYEQAVREGWADDQKAWDKWLNDPANKVFRVWEGRV
jgi:hypothetical protein